MQSPLNQTPRSIQFGCHNTRLNLPAATSLKRGESNFLARFEKLYFATELKTSIPKRQFASGREFGLDGFGRADLLFMAWNPIPRDKDFTAFALKNRLQLTAIEGKLKDWRKGLMQAARYRFFANRSILVLPPISAAIALGFMETFRELKVGLWEFDASVGRLRKHFTPRTARPLNNKARQRAVHLIQTSLQGAILQAA